MHAYESIELSGQVVGSPYEVAPWATRLRSANIGLSIATACPDGRAPGWRTLPPLPTTTNHVLCLIVRRQRHLMRVKAQDECV